MINYSYPAFRKGDDSDYQNLLMGDVYFAPLDAWASSFDNRYIRSNGSTPLSADWDAGDHQIRAKQFYPDVATGTAPFVVNSTTKVANLNADLLDGYHAGNSSGQIPISNGTKNTNLNADMVDGYHSDRVLRLALHVDKLLQTSSSAWQYLHEMVNLGENYKGWKLGIACNMVTTNSSAYCEVRVRVYNQYNSITQTWEKLTYNGTSWRIKSVFGISLTGDCYGLKVNVRSSVSGVTVKVSGVTFFLYK